MIRCENCQHLLISLRNSEHCVICQELGCRFCFSSNGLCSKCNSQLPSQFKNKFWFWSHFLPGLALVGFLMCLSWGAFELPPWPLLPSSEIFLWNHGWKSYLGIIFGILCLLCTILFPKMARRKYGKWMQEIKNVEELEKQIQMSHQKSTSNRYDRLTFSNSKIWKLFFIFGFLVNLSLFWMFLTKEATLFSQGNLFLDILLGLSFFINFTIIIHVFKKEPYFDKVARVIQRLRNGWTNLILLAYFVVYGGQVYLIPSVGGFFYTAESWLIFLLNFHQISVLCLFGASLWLFLDLLILEPILDRKNQNALENQNNKTDQTLNTRSSKNSLVLEKIFFLGTIFLRFCEWLLIGIIFLAIMVGGVIFIIGDYFMLISFFSVPIAVGFVVPGTLWLWQLLNHPLVSPSAKKRIHSKINFRAIQRITTIGLVFGLVFLLPIMCVPIYSNPSLDQQFSEQFGVDWELTSQSKMGQFGTLRSTHYSFFENLFLFNFTSNRQINVPYMIDYPPRVQGNTSIIEHTFYFDAYLPADLQFGTENNNEIFASLRLPVIILMHGELEEKGAWNANMTSQYLARQGYLVCDLNYAYLHTTTIGTNNTGYYLPDLVRQIGMFTKFLASNAEFYHADLNKVYFAGRHLGGGLALLCGMGYNTTLSSLFASNMQVQGIIPMYPVSDIGTDQSFLQETMLYYGEGYIKGSTAIESTDYNSDWIKYNPIRLLESISTTIAPIFFISGTHDWVIPMRYSAPFLEVSHQKKVSIITGFYLFGNDGFDGAMNSPFGQSIIYYLNRFLILTS